MKRKLIIRASVVAILILLALFLYNNGKGYTLLLDNKKIESAGSTFKALDMVEVRVDRKEQIELFPGDRDMVVVSGRKHTISITVYNKSFAEDGVYKKEFKLQKGGGMYLLSMPAIAADLDEWIELYAP